MEAAVRVRLFGPYREIAGADELVVRLPQGSTVMDLRAELARRLGSAALLSGMGVALNRRYAAERDVVSEGDEVALIPPVAGG